MRKLPVLIGTLATFALAFATSPSSYGQKESGESGRANQNQSGKQGHEERSSHAMTIRGVVAAITAEGEIVYDYHQNKAIEAEAAFMTVIGSPRKWEGGKAEHAAASAREGGKEQHAARSAHEARSEQSDAKRDNVYIVWLSPKTKVCKCMEGSEGAHKESVAGSQKEEKKECSLADLEVGDRVEVAFTPREESGGHQFGHQNEKMRQTHGRRRTYVGTADEVTIVEREGEGHSASQEKHESGR